MGIRTKKLDRVPDAAEAAAVLRVAASGGIIMVIIPERCKLP